MEQPEEVQILDEKEEKARKKKEKEKEKKKEKAKKDKEKEKEGGKDGKKKNKQAELIKELLRRKQEQEEEEKRAREEEERRLAELERQKEEQEKLAQQRKEEAKRRKEELIQKQKREGTFLTKKQKQAAAKARQLLESQGHVVPELNRDDEEKPKKPIFARKRGAKKTSEVAENVEEQQSVPEEEKVVEEKNEVKEDLGDEEEVVDDWETIVDSGREINIPDKLKVIKEELIPKPSTKQPKNIPSTTSELNQNLEEESSDSSSEDDESYASESSIPTISKETREELVAKIRLRFAERSKLAKEKKTTDILRSPIICVLGHVDTGKTKMLDTIRRTNVQEGEAGGITQQIGATRVPDLAIKERCKMLKNFSGDSMKIPGFLIIDTPGHESFANMRSRGSSLCDFAILVVDIMHGLEQQTIESLKLLIKRKTPFVVALNKVDRLYKYESNPRKDIWQHMNTQPTNTQLEFRERFNKLIGEFSEQGINIELANKNTNFDEYVSVVPTSAFLGDGIGNLMAHIVDQCQNRYLEKLAFSEELDCIVMEVRSLPGLGTTIDVILINGTLRVNDIIVLTGSDGPIATPIRDLLMPQPLKEIRVKADYEHYKEINGAQGIKILAKNLEKVIAGLPLFVAHREDELEVLKMDAEDQLKNALMAIKKKPEGVYVQASTLGSLEALLEFLKAQKIPVWFFKISFITLEPRYKLLLGTEKLGSITQYMYVQSTIMRPIKFYTSKHIFIICCSTIKFLIFYLKYSNVNIGPVHKRDVQKAAAMLEHNSEFACILAFDVPVDREVQLLADKEGVRIFQANIIYHLEESFLNYRKELALKRRKENEHLAIFPYKLRVLPQHIFNARNPIVCGVSVDAGQLKKGTPVTAKTKEGPVFLGTISSIEKNHEQVDMAKAGDEVCIKIENTTGDAPKLYGRHFTHEDILISKITRESIDVCKTYFRDDLTKADWQLVIELKRMLEIL
ncbi:unnamed protein product [Meloidogyne enterolobii]|uniref:Uncharacterized protein n=1 Tax=Meloidogyne enterolobii TaxID=390850 RepID=A0ACB0ZEZ7_MELEN